MPLEEKGTIINILCLSPAAVIVALAHTTQQRGPDEEYIILEWAKYILKITVTCKANIDLVI